jgi:acyl-CoA thioesterase-1
MANAPPVCNPHLELFSFRHPLSRLRDALETRRRIKIIAIGSSSTAGESNIIPFPHRLELALRSFYPGRMIDVVNRGIGGQEAPEELARFESDVTIEAPTLVIWQVGTNAIYHRELYDPPSVARIVETGVSWLKNLQADVILMDMQYAPALFRDKDGKPDYGREKDARNLVSMISAVAGRAEVNVFQRFALMEHWVTTDRISWTDLIGADGLHQTEFATGCVTEALKAAITVRVGPVPGALPPMM